jgi:hypothetical protein
MIVDLAKDARLMKETMVLLRAGAIEPIDPIRSFDISNAVDAARSFMQPTHIGKVVITCGEMKKTVKVRNPIQELTLNNDGTYIVLGGFGGLGRSMITWMAKRGAKHLLVISRSAKLAGDNKVWIEDLEKTYGCQISAFQCDVCKSEDVKRVKEFVEQSLSPVRGIIHSAMFLRVMFNVAISRGHTDNNAGLHFSGYDQG